METYMKKSTLNNLPVLSRMTLALFASLINLFMVKQAPRAWYVKMDSFLLDNDFSRCHSDNNVYAKIVDGYLIILVLYVDDLVLTSGDPKLINHV